MAHQMSHIHNISKGFLPFCGLDAATLSGKKGQRNQVAWLRYRHATDFSGARMNLPVEIFSRGWSLESP
jgi:hypothetical protein